MAIITRETIVAQLESTEEFPIYLSDVWDWLGYSRKDSAVQAFKNSGTVEGQDFAFFQIVQENKKGDLRGRPSQEIKMTIDAFKAWAMQAQTDRGKQVRAYYLKIEKEWRESRQTRQPQITAEQIEAFQFQKEVFNPWSSQNPIAASVFLDWQGIQSRTIASQPQQALELPSGAMQQALNGAFLNLNRSGLAMNKLFHFLDRIPTMHGLSEKTIADLAEALDEAGQTIDDLKRDRDLWKEECDRQHNAAESLRRVLGETEATIADLRTQIKNLQNRSSSSPLAVVATVVRKGDRRSNGARLLPGC